MQWSNHLKFLTKLCRKHFKNLEKKLSSAQDNPAPQLDWMDESKAEENESKEIDYKGRSVSQ